MFKSKKLIGIIALSVLVVVLSVVCIAGRMMSCDHVFTDYKSNGNATYFSDGTKTAKCDNGCGKRNTVPDSGSQLQLSKVENLVASQTLNSVTLSWDKIEDVTGYSVYYKSDEEWQELIASTKNTSYTAENLQSGTKYYFAVRTYKKSFNKVVWAEETATLYTSTKCDAINEVTSTPGSTTVKLDWEKVSGADGYRVYVKVDDDWQTAGEYVTETSFTVENLTPVESYKFAVCSYMQTDSIALSDLTEHEAYTVTEAPKTTIELLSKNQISLTFESVDGAEGYQIYRKINSGKIELYEAYDEASSLNIILEADNYYTYAVRGYITVKGETVYGEFNPVSVHCGAVEDRIVVDPSEGEWYLVLVNKTRELPLNYSVELDAIADGYSIDSRVAVYYNKMYADAEKDGINLMPVSGYRSNAMQKEIFEETVEGYINDEGMSQDEAEAKTATEVLSPGTSEHNLGFAVDVGCAEGYFEDSEAYVWLLENAHKYGFIERYTKEKQSITGIIPEPWHWRFVGVEYAGKIKQSGLCLEEYLAKYNLIP